MDIMDIPILHEDFTLYMLMKEKIAYYLLNLFTRTCRKHPEWSRAKLSFEPSGLVL